MEEKTQDKYKELIEGDPIVANEQSIEQSQEVPEIKEEKKPEIEVPQSTNEEIAKEVEPRAVTPVQPTDDLKNEEQVKVLREIAFEKGLDTAIEEAKKLNNPYILDEFHDDLIDKFYKKLVEAGKLEQR